MSAGTRDAAPEPAPLRVLNLIARLSVGGAPVQAAIVTGRLDPARFRAWLAAGEVPPGEASMADAVGAYGPEILQVPGLDPRIRPLADLRALVNLIRLMRRLRPDVVHTHTAKAGFLGRLAAATLRPRPAIVHTYHGHVLEGYFGRAKTALYRGLEKLAARVSDRLFAPSQATVDELVRIGVAPAERFRVVPLGLDLGPFAEVPAAEAAAARAELGARDGDILCVFVGRLVAVKRVDVLLEAIAESARAEPGIRLAVIGDGELRAELEQQAARLGVAERVCFAGVRSEMPRYAAAADVAVLSSDHEGTPVALIEAAAAGRPAATTDAGGVREVVTPDSGLVVGRGAPVDLAGAIARLARDPQMRERMGSAAREHAFERFTAERLVTEMSAQYEELAAARSAQGAKG